VSSFRSTRTPALCAAAALALCAVSPARAEGEPEVTFPARGIVEADRLNVRRGPGVDPPIGQVGKGTELLVRKKHGDWLEIDYPEVLGPWVSSTCVGADIDLEGAAPEAPLAARITKNKTRVRALPSRRGLVLDELKRDTALTVVGLVNGWCRITPPKDLRVYIHADYVTLADASTALTPELAPVERARTTPSEARPAPRRGSLPEGVAEKIRVASDLLVEDGPFAQVENALRLLEEALATPELTDVQRSLTRRRVAELVGSLSPTRWLELIRLAKRSQQARLDDIDRRYAVELADARDSLMETPRVEYTVRGELRASADGRGAYRLHAGDVVVCELDARGADLSPFLGRNVGVVGKLKDAETPGAPPLVEVQYVEETIPPRPVADSAE